MITRSSLLKKAKIWFPTVAVCALPSFLLGLMASEHSIGAMLFGTFVVAVTYTFVTASSFATKTLKQRLILARAFRMGFGVKIFMAVLATLEIGMSILNVPFPSLFSAVDLYVGLFALYAYSEAMKILGMFQTPSSSFFDTFAVTLIDAAFMSLLVLIFSLIVWGGLVAWRNLSAKPSVY